MAAWRRDGGPPSRPDGPFRGPRISAMKAPTTFIAPIDSSAAALYPRHERNARVRKQRDLSKAVALRPAEVFALYGIPSSTLCELCRHPDPAKRLPSMLIPGRCGRKGLRLINHDELRAWLDRWKAGQLNINSLGNSGTRAAA